MTADQSKKLTDQIAAILKDGKGLGFKNARIECADFVLEAKVEGAKLTVTVEGVGK